MVPTSRQYLQRNLGILVILAVQCCCNYVLSFTTLSSSSKSLVNKNAVHMELQSASSHYNVRRSSIVQLLSASPSEEAEEYDDIPIPTADTMESIPPPPPQQPVAPPQPRDKKLDPLLASLTRMDKETMNTPSVKAPIFGEIPIDGSLIVLIPVSIIAVVGLIMSVNVAINAQDAISNSLYQLGDEISKAALGQTSSNANLDPNVCRGLCSSQEESYEAMKSFMQSLSSSK